MTGVSIMNRPTVAEADVRDMLCAQALAVVAQALERLPIGGILLVRYGAEDVRKDLLAWAAERGHAAAEADPGTLRLERHR